MDKYCWLYKSGGPYATHKTDKDGRPACGTKIDEMCLTTSRDDPGPPYCRWCFKDPKTGDSR